MNQVVFQMTQVLFGSSVSPMESCVKALFPRLWYYQQVEGRLGDRAQ